MSCKHSKITCCSLSYFFIKPKSADVFFIYPRINGVVEFMAKASGLFMLMRFTMALDFEVFLSGW